MLHYWMTKTVFSHSTRKFTFVFNLCPVCTHIQVAIKKVISTFSHGLAIFNNKRVVFLYSLGLINLHMKSAKHVKMNRTSFVSQNFFKGLQQ